MAADVLITCLPCEIIEYILENKSLEFQDVLNFSLTCKYLYKAVTSSNNLWKRKFFQRWPHLAEVYENTEKNGKRISSWLEEIQSSIQSRKNLIDMLSLMSQKNYKKQELAYSEMKEFDVLFCPEAHPLAYHFFIDELTSLIGRSILNTNLTNKYYALKVIRYLKQRYLAEEWKKFIHLPQEKQTLEKGAILVSQWSQPEKQISESQIASILDGIVERSKQAIRIRYPAHPLLSASREDLDEWKTTNISDNKWNKTATQQIMNILCEVMFEKMKFHGNSEMYYSSENSFIDQVLEHRRGIPITLAIIFESVAKRLGVRCEPVSFPAHFLLRWKEKYNYPETEEVESFYIDVFNGGKFLTKNSCPRIGGTSKCPIAKFNIHQATTAVEVVQRMANNLEVAARQRTQLNGRAARLRSALELLHLVRPHDTNTILHLARFYMLHQMDLSDLVHILTEMQKDVGFSSRGQANHILQMLQDYEKHMKILTEEDTSPKLRCPEVKYAIGMIMKHRIHGYFCVITGWDPQCNASADWMIEMNVHDNADKPFYNVIVEDGSTRYAAQENLVIAPTSQWIDHDEIGRYFYKYCSTHYLPNQEKEREYPEDAKVRNQLLKFVKN